MKKCGHCGQPVMKGMSRGSYEGLGHDEDQELDEVRMKDEVLGELMDLFSGSLGDRLSSAKKPKAVPIEMISAPGVREEDEEEEEV